MLRNSIPDGERIFQETRVEAAHVGSLPSLSPLGYTWYELF